MFFRFFTSEARTEVCLFNFPFALTVSLFYMLSWFAYFRVRKKKSTQCQYTQRDSEKNWGKTDENTRIFMGYCLQTVNMSRIRGKICCQFNLFFFGYLLSEFERSILWYGTREKIEPQLKWFGDGTKDLFPHSSICKKKKFTKKSFQNVQCRFISLFKILQFSVVCATKLPRPSKSMCDSYFDALLWIFSMLSFFFSHFLFAMVYYMKCRYVCMYVVPFGFILFYFLRLKCLSVMCTYLYNSLLFPLIVFNSWKLRAAQPPLPLPLPELQTYCDYIEISILCKIGCDPTVKLCFISSIFSLANITMCVRVRVCFLLMVSHRMVWYAYFIQMHTQSVECALLSLWVSIKLWGAKTHFGTVKNSIKFQCYIHRPYDCIFFTEVTACERHSRHFIHCIVVSVVRKIINLDIEMETHHTYVLQSWILSMKIKYDEFYASTLSLSLSLTLIFSLC